MPPFHNSPFQHLYIENLFTEQDFLEIINTPEINIKARLSDKKILQTLQKQNYQIIEFPGCVTSADEYLAWHKTKVKTHRITTSIEGFGMVLCSPNFNINF